MDLESLVFSDDPAEADADIIENAESDWEQALPAEGVKNER